MATKQFPHKNVFSAGEVSERFEGRSDVGKYYSALKRLINFLPFTQGGVTRRPGTRFGQNNFCDLQGRIIPFKFTRDVDSNFIVHLCDESLSITDDEGVSVVTGAVLELQCEEIVGSGIFKDAADPGTNCAPFSCFGSAQLFFKAVSGVPPYSWSITSNGNSLPVLVETGVNNEDLEVLAPVTIQVGPQVVTLFQVGKATCGHVGFPASIAHGGVVSTCGYDCLNGFVFCNSFTGVQANIKTLFGAHPVTGCSLLPPDFLIFDICANHLGHCNSSLLVNCFPADPNAPPYFTIDCACVSQLDLQVGTNEQAEITRCGGVNDLRTPAQLAGGCNPCSLEFKDVLLTLTDSVGTMITIPIENFNNEP